MSKKKLLIVLAALAALSTIAGLIGDAREARMEAYAKANNCTWHYSWYVNEEPVCK
jgi:hypothetical protein